MHATTVKPEPISSQPQPVLAGATRLALVVEDDADMRRLIASSLQRDGLDVIEAGGGIDFLEWMELTTSTAASGLFHVIVSDVNMPDLGALDVLGSFHRHHRM